MKRTLLLLLTLISSIVILTSCNTEHPIEDSQYKKDNDAFIQNAEQKGYKKQIFLNAEYPIYYKVIKTSNKQGAKYPLQDSQVKVNLSGKLITGEIFQQEGIITTPINKLILGVQYALQMMNEGDRWEVVIPYQLGYGPYSNNVALPGYSTLIFDIELLEVTVQ